MIRSNLDERRRRTERTNVHRQRHQKGSLQVRQHGERKMWVLLYRDGDTRKYATLGQYSKMSKSEAQAKRDELIAEANARNATAPDPHITFGEFLEGTALPFLRSKWKRSTAATTENRIQHHLRTRVRGKTANRSGLEGTAGVPEAKAETLSRSVVAHLRWDLRSVFRLALAEGYTDRDPTAALFTPREAAPSPSPSMSKEEVEHYINALDLRERVIALLAIFVGHAPRRDSGASAPPCKRRLLQGQDRAATLPRRHRHAEDDQLNPHRRHSAEDSQVLKGMDGAGAR